MRTGGTLPGSIAAPDRTLQRCWSACRTCRRDATASCSTRWPPRAARRCSTCTSTPTTTASVLTLAGDGLLEAVRALALARGGAHRPRRARRRAPALRGARRRAVRRAARHATRARGDAARDFGAWVVEALGVPVFLYDAADPRRGRCPTRAVRRSPHAPPISVRRDRTPRWARSRSARVRRWSRSTAS